MDRAAIILAGGVSSRFGQDKGLLSLAKKPLVKHVLEAVNKMVNEKILVTSSKAQAENYGKIANLAVKILVDAERLQSPLVGALTGFQEAKSEYSLLLSCDAPFISTDVLALLFELCMDRNAVIPRWPNGYIEPLHAVYRTQHALEASKTALNCGELRMQCMVDKVRGVRYVSTLVLQQFDPELRTFFNVNTPIDLKRAENLFKSRR